MKIVIIIIFYSKNLVNLRLDTASKQVGGLDNNMKSSPRLQ